MKDDGKWRRITDGATPREKVEAIRKAAHERDLKAMPYILTALDDHSGGCFESPGLVIAHSPTSPREAAIVALGEFEYCEANQQLEAIRERDPDGDIRYVATWALVGTGAIDLDDLEKEWSHTEEERCRFVCLRASVGSKKERREYLLRLLGDRAATNRIRRYAIDALAYIGVRVKKRWFRNKYVVVEDLATEAERPG